MKYLSNVVIVWLSLYIYIYIYIYIHTYNCTKTLYELPLLPNSTAVKHFYTNRSGAKC